MPSSLTRLHSLALRVLPSARLSRSAVRAPIHWLFSALRPCRTTSIRRTTRSTRVTVTSGSTGPEYQPAYPSATPCGLTLGPPNSRSMNGAGKTLGLLGGWDSHPSSFATHAGILTPPASTEPHGTASTTGERSPTRRCLAPSQLRWRTLSPDYFRRRIAPPVSFYTLVGGWLLSSQPFGRLGNPTTLLTLSPHLGTLAGDPGCFPLAHGVIPHGPTPEDSRVSSQRMIPFGITIRGFRQRSDGIRSSTEQCSN